MGLPIFKNFFVSSFSFDEAFSTIASFSPLKIRSLMLSVILFGGNQLSYFNVRYSEKFIGNIISLVVLLAASTLNSKFNAEDPVNIINIFFVLSNRIFAVSLHLLSKCDSSTKINNSLSKYAVEVFWIS